MTQDKTQAALAQDIDEARRRLVSFVEHCTEADWQAAPVDGDPRPVGVIADHVADAYEYLTRFIGDLITGQPAEVSPDIIDALNAEHAADARTVTRAHVSAHLGASGDALVALVAGLAPGQLEIGDGRVRRFAIIAARHADDHRAQLEECLAGR